MIQYDIPIHAGQIWTDGVRILTVKKTNDRHAYCFDETGRRTRILKRRLNPVSGFNLMKYSPARYVDVPSESDPKVTYHVWTGDEFSPAHCTCQNFRWATRIHGEAYHCKHLRLVLFKKGMQ